ncbi:hypothetical protein J2S00_001802 [Caldalkalibacillus uzonensis]|uniref:Integrase SAM-like N-terminal domain-containing protein n=1 Tax=Caldalkalibacillus uzonensis TaxID=353224 RepID=A0ABU0CSY7_9BACI|nr:hypothetical protein [Caldalkalibacillus uzonensis]MDQ0339016.1 hypothetical protein [Caldalkalibacillus uzonensis]
MSFAANIPASVGYDEIRSFLHYAITVQKLSSASVNSAYGAIKFYYQSNLRLLRQYWKSVSPKHLAFSRKPRNQADFGSHHNPFLNMP